MPQSPEIRIYESGPAPTPTELKEGVKLLLDSYGKNTRFSSGTEILQELKVGFGQIHLDGKPTEVVIFRNAFNSNDPEGESCTGFDVYARTIDRYQKDNSQPHIKTHAIEVHTDVYGNLVAVDHEKPFNQALSEQERRGSGTLIQRVWENIVQEREFTPSAH